MTGINHRDVLDIHGDILLPARGSNHTITNGHRRRIGSNHLTNPGTVHDATGSRRTSVASTALQAGTRSRCNGESKRLNQYLIRACNGHRRIGEFVVLSAQLARW